MAGIYETFYKLTTDPFRLSPDHRFSFGHPSYKKAKAYMQYALQRGEGFIMVTGAPGTGKTTLINDMLSQIDDKQITVVSLLSTRLKPDDMLHMVATSLGIPCDEARKSALLVKIKEALTQQHRTQRRVVLMVDEAQDLSAGVLEELRLLSNMQMGSNLLLQVFLVGQEPLIKLVKKPEMEHLRQRIIAATHLDPLSIEDTAAFIIYRLKRAGWEEDPVITSSALESIYRYSGGVPRRINLVCSRLLFFGAVEEKHTLDKAEVDTVIEGMQDEMLFGEDTARPQPDSSTQPPVPDRRFAQRVRGAGSVAYAVPDKALEEPDPAMPLSEFFDVVSEKPDDLMEVVPVDVETEANASERIEPQLPESSPDDEIASLEALETELEIDRLKDLDPDLNVTHKSEVIQFEEPLAVPDPEPDSHRVEIDTHETPEPYEERSEKQDGKGWGGVFLAIVLMVVVASAAFVFFRSEQIGKIDLYEQFTGWLEDQGVSFVLPLKDPNEPGTAPGREKSASQNAQVVNQDASNAVAGWVEKGDSLSQPSAGADVDIMQPGEVADDLSGSAGIPGSSEPETSDSVVDEALAASTGESGFVQQIEEQATETEAPPALMEQLVQDDTVSVDSSQSVTKEPGIAAVRPESTGEDLGITDDKIPSDVTVTDGGSAVNPLRVEAIEHALEESGTVTGELIAEKKDVEIASLTARSISEKPVGELAVLKTGPDQIPASIPSAYISNEGRDYSLVEIRSRLKSGRWGAFGEPAALLPSTVNHCKDEGVRILCWTAPQQAADENGDTVIHQIESTMDGFSSSGTFEVRYRIMETAMNVSDQDMIEGAQVNVMPGWKVSEYETLCRIVHANLIRCYGGDEGVFSYTVLQ